ncbi:MAG: SufD family Fe-S cluster assembly protein [Prevotella sp.]|nr:SufD family Fe-S cluster assembly protein [Bacteroides sp.]MCM1366587.1 SufD family Fe-S cluster assembly protein [Prevotella sp.]MCM1437256.1 SufD family Fe-S cluster assembly protein [Prevotella sp.]
MNVIRQYLDLYKDNTELVNSNSAPIINSLRNESFDRLQNTVLPKLGAENHEITDLNAILAPNYGLNIARVPIDVNPSASFHCDVPNLSTTLFLMLNDIWAETDLSRRSIPQGVIIDSLRNAALNHPELVEKYYGKIADKNNPLVNLDTLLVQDGFFMYIPKGIKLEKPVQLVNILQNGAPLMAVRRVLIVIEDGAEARLLVCDHTQNPDIDFLSLQTIEIFAGKNVRFDLYDMEESTPRTNRLSTLYLNQQADSNVLIDGITLFNGNTRNEFYCNLNGENSELHLLGLAIEDKQRHCDNFTLIRHNVPRCRSNELFKYTLDDESRGSFIGRIYVDMDSSMTEAYQSNRNLLGNNTSRMVTKPQLEIYNDDVKCSHGTATGQLDAMQLFYMRTRGLSENAAKLLLKQAFMSDVVEGVRLPVMRDRLKTLVERRLSGAKMLCHDCSMDTTACTK